MKKRWLLALWVAVVCAPSPREDLQGVQMPPQNTQQPDAPDASNAREKEEGVKRAVRKTAAYAADARLCEHGKGWQLDVSLSANDATVTAIPGGSHFVSREQNHHLLRCQYLVFHEAWPHRRRNTGRTKGDSRRGRCDGDIFTEMKETAGETMDLQQYLDHLNAAKYVEAESEVQRFMHRVSQEALRLTAELNGSDHTPEGVRALLSRITGKPVDETVGMFPPFYPIVERTLPSGKTSLSTRDANFRTKGESSSMTER